ncbi:MAG TPA: hypothetical protein VHB21_23225, partial [Minicystis sp.]|nr:hypothetical protein [Minicystis sp.]
GPPARGVGPWVIVFGSTAATAFAVSTGFGISAIAHNPGGSARTGNGVSIGDLESNASTAHRDAVVADLSFAAGAIAAGLTVYLYLSGRASRSTPPPDGVPAATLARF